MSIKRYKLWQSNMAPPNGDMRQSDSGDFVKHDDHLATIATLTAERDQLGRVYLEVCQDAVNAHDTIDQLRKELAEAKAVVENLVECVKDSPMGMVITDKKDTWNPDAHIEITLTVADVHAALAALAWAEAKKGEQP